VVRTASDWSKCGQPPFEVPPTSEWPNIVQTLRFVRDEVIPAVGPVEPVSAYRNPQLNACAGGSQESAHLGFFALDLVPLTPTSREALVRILCEVHDRRGKAYGAGLGFYSFASLPRRLAGLPPLGAGRRRILQCEPIRGGTARPAKCCTEGRNKQTLVLPKATPYRRRPKGV
jgi:hypothetical protein